MPSERQDPSVGRCSRLIGRKYYLCWGIAVLSLTFSACERSPHGEAHGVRYYSNTLENPNRTVHVVEIPRAHFARDYRLVTKTSPGGVTSAATISQVLSESPPSDTKNIIAMINGTWLTGKGPVWTGVLRGPYVREGELIHAPGAESGHSAGAFWINGQSNLWLGGVQVSVDLLLENGFTLGVELNRERGPAEAAVYTRGAFSSGETADAATGRYRLPTTSGVEYVLSPVGPGRPRLELPSGGSSGDERRFFVKRIVRGGGAELDAGELALSVGPDAEKKAPSQFSTIAAGSLVSLIVKFKTRLRYGKCSPQTENGEQLDIPMMSSGGMILLVKDEEGEPHLPPETLNALDRQVRAPRSTVCWNEANFYMVTVDGFRLTPTSLLRTILGLDTSVGMTDLELTDYLRQSLGCECAIMLDGGKSSSLFFAGNVVNRPATGSQFPSNGYIALLAQ